MKKKYRIQNPFKEYNHKHPGIAGIIDSFWYCMEGELHNPKGFNGIFYLCRN